MSPNAAIHSLCAKCGEKLDGGSMLLTSDRKLYHIHCSPYEARPSGKISEAMVEAAMSVPTIPNRGPNVFDEGRMSAALLAALSVPTPGTGGAEQERIERENTDFHEWWNRSGHAADATFTLTMENCAHAAWQARALSSSPVGEMDGWQPIETAPKQGVR